ncbi:CHAT domain-containing protein [Laspinema olomoucense]|uniref:CHAT domain-containing protein n=1 Tax=Laspinema olomoucense D3b TaxID=2953688 RepID=A0ABT2NGC5_9CYAN|nr:CHAT domain-containing protein [Laspinema sp. D3b]MCT7980790.1 CHAT domain-containing protein [Laspinema sp. D3b]
MMNQDRKNDYLKLIKSLLESPGKEAEILKGNKHLLDSGLLQVIEEVADGLLESGDLETHNQLQGLYSKIANIVSKLSANSISDESKQIIQEALTASRQSSLDSTALYQVLQKHLAKLTENFAKDLRQWVKINVVDCSDPTKAKEMANAIHYFSVVIGNFPLGSRASNIEIAIAGQESILDFYTLENFPLAWAMVHLNLGDNYSERIRGNPTENFEISIKALKKALQVFTREKFPELWAGTQNNLGESYRKLSAGNRAENLEQAITCYNNALQVRTKNTEPEEWARVQHNLGLAYKERIKGDRATNLEEAITCFHNGLLFRTYEALPQKWAMTQNALGDAYLDRIMGNPVENVELAIECLKNAQKVRTRQAMPEKWAMAEHNLGKAYISRVRGLQSQNVEQAIKYYISALEVRTREAFPVKWAMTLHNLGNAYLSNVWTDRTENIEKAIACYQNALQVRTRETFPHLWANTQSSLGDAYSQRRMGDKWRNQELAIQCYNNALQVHTEENFPRDWAGVHFSLGLLHASVLKGNPEWNLQQAIQYYQDSLRVYQKDTLPESWASTQQYLGLAYKQQKKISEAIECFQLALAIYQPTTFPSRCVDCGRQLGDIAKDAGRWADAIQGYGAAIDAIEQLRTWIGSESDRQALVESYSDLYKLAVEACIKNEQLDKAFEYVERSRSKRLVDLMASHSFSQEEAVSPEVNQLLLKFDAIRKQIDEIGLINESESTEIGKISDRKVMTRALLQQSNEAIKFLETQKQKVWEEIRKLDPVLAGEVQVESLDICSLQRLIETPNTAILSFYTTFQDTYIFVIKQDNISCHTCKGEGLLTGQGWWVDPQEAEAGPKQENFAVMRPNEQGELTLQNWIGQNWVVPYQYAREEWKESLSSILSQIAQRLQLDELIDLHLQSIEELIIVPYLYLHQVPFAALPLQDAHHKYLGDKFIIRYVPSCQILKFCQEREPLSDKLAYGTVENATEDLACASFEGEEISKLYEIPDSLRLRGGNQATVSQYRELAKQVQVLHCSHHAQLRIDRPLESKLVLSDGSITFRVSSSNLV